MNGLSIVIPSRNAVNLIDCVSAIRASGETCRIIVVDDGIDWEKAETRLGLDANRPELERVNGVAPFVFARNVNIGIRAAGTDDVVVLNDDALLRFKAPYKARGFSLMQAIANDIEDAGIISASTNSVGNPNQQWRVIVPGSGTLLEEDRMLCFIAVLIPRRTIDRVGLLDERYVDYGLDDDDYSLQVRKSGLKLYVYNDCFVDHSCLRSSFRGPAGAGGDFKANMKRFVDKWGMDNWGKVSYEVKA